MVTPTTFPKVISRSQSSKGRTRKAAQLDKNTIVRFDDLSEEGKKAALEKSHRYNTEQSVPSPSQKSNPTQSETPRHSRLQSLGDRRPYIMAFFGLGFIVLAVLASLALAVDKDKDPSLVAKLRLANTNLDRLKLLPKDEDWVFDFTKQDKYTFSPGGVINANAATFPATVGLGLTLAVLNLGPCAMLPPHLHPRGANFVVAISGTTQTYMINENGARTVQATLRSGQMTIFPEGSIHTMMNVGCDNAQLISALNSDDTGTLNVANSFFSLPQNISGTIMGGGVNVSDIEGKVPDPGTGANSGPHECLAVCAARANGTRGLG
ncbi:hypothetical protein PV08_12008 [Exophiala spinifera]|uniref:Cupin type-1 domain-containing protein n=1 Tax=Exophiala spinifera TaxID=91928 RepID=A0A0D2BEA3_9EURO|nr:uncharacterized protein PV08_12008 [Exophiala spinifera]KIW09724.1 hypothetical protein PV08_12008 [Exophiala spinifera]